MRRKIAALLSLGLGVCGIGHLCVANVANAATPESLFGATVPKITADADPGSVSLGVKFNTKVAGKVTGVRFYKGATNTGTHTGGLYSSTGTELAKATFAGETASGWQSVKFASPVVASAGQSFTAAMFAPRGHYAVKNPSRWPMNTASLTGKAGVYKYGSALAYPGSVFGSSNYFVDVAFTPSASAAPTGAGSSTAPPTTPPTTAQPTAAPPTTAPPTSGFPDASNTGVTPGTVLKSSGCVNASTPGQIVENLTITDCDISVNAPNVIIRNVRMLTSSREGWSIIIRSGSATIDHVTIAGKNATTGSVEYAVLSQTSSAVRISHSNLSLCADCIQGENLTVTDNYIHDMANIEGTSHVDGIQCNSSCGVTITGNTILNEYGQTSAIALFGDFGTPKNSLIRGNLLAGGGYSIYGGVAGSTNIMIDRNTISKRFYAKGGQYGWLVRGGGNTITGNKFDDGSVASP